MGYRIVYGDDPWLSNKTSRDSRRLRGMICAGLLLFSILVRGFWPKGAQELRRMILPEGTSNTQLAADQLIADLREGMTFPEAFTAFCTDILLDETDS